MNSRRDFLNFSAAALPMLTLHNSKLWAAAKHLPQGVQLYTVRDQAQRNLPETFRKVREVGIEQVETYGDSYTRSALHLKDIIGKAGLRAPSGHFDYETLPGKIEYADHLRSALQDERKGTEIGKDLKSAHNAHEQTWWAL